MHFVTIYYFGTKQEIEFPKDVKTHLEFISKQVSRYTYVNLMHIVSLEFIFPLEGIDETSEVFYYSELKLSDGRILYLSQKFSDELQNQINELTNSILD